MYKKVHPITEWLDNSCRKKAPLYKLNHRYLDTYYMNNDKNLLCNDEFKIKELYELNKKINSCNDYDELIENKEEEELYYEDDLISESHYVHIFKKKDKKRFIQYIDPSTPRYHTNMLFNMIVDYCKENEIHDFKGNLLFGRKMRNDFVQFCFDNKN